MVSPPLDLCTEWKPESKEDRKKTRRLEFGSTGLYDLHLTDASINPSAEYSRRLQDRKRWLKESKHKTEIVSMLRLSAGGLFLLTLYTTLALHRGSVWFAIVPVAAYVGLVIYSQRVYPREQRALKAVAFYERGLARIAGEWRGTGNTSTAFADPGNLYVNDLDIFGEGSLFELLCTARTQAGQDTLAKWLSQPAARDEILKRQEAIDELRNNIDLREDLAILGREFRTTIQPDLMTDWATAPIQLDSIAARIAAPCLVAFTSATFIYMWWFGGPLMLFYVAALLHAGFGTWKRIAVKEVKTAVESHAREFGILHVTLTRLERDPFVAPKLRDLQDQFGTALKEVKALVRLIENMEAARNEMLIFVAAFIMWNTQVSYAIEAWRKRNGAFVEGWLKTVGEMEALCAVAGYAFEHPEDPFPEIVEGPAVLEAEDAGHPLLPRAQCVPNSVAFIEGLQLFVISGSNMSGKSTLLRTIGTNVVLALAGAPVRATRMRLSRLAIGATLRVQDSLHGGTSRFYAEVRRLRDIMELTEGPLPVLLLLDEILYGTNSHDRVIGAEAVIRGLVERGAIGFVTTHDLALATVADSLAPRAANAHFEDRLEDGKMFFDYTLRPGVVQRSNALALMRAVGLKV